MKKLMGTLLCFFCLSAISADFSNSVKTYQTEKSLKTLLDAFTRKYSKLDSVSHLQSVLTTGTDLFPAFGFAPSEPDFSWNFEIVSSDITKLCVSKQLYSIQDWIAHIKALKSLKFEAANSSCVPSSYSVPTSFPAVSYSFKALNRKSVVAETILNANFTVSGWVSPAVTTPGITLTANTGQTSSAHITTITNVLRYARPDTSICTPAEVLIDPLCQPINSGVSSIEISTGFSATHTCATLAGGASCTIDTTYTNATGVNRLLGQLIINFSTGEIIRTTLLGLKP